MANPEPPARSYWVDTEGRPISCLEKIKVLDQNLEEIRGACQDALEDAVLMGCDEEQIRAVLRQVVDGLVNPYGRGRPAA